LFTFSEHQRYDRHAQDTLVIGPYDGSAGQPIPGTREAQGLRLLADAPRPQLRGYQPDVAADLDWHELRFQWLDAVLRGRARPALLDSPVVFELMGQNQWRKARSVT